MSFSLRIFVPYLQVIHSLPQYVILLSVLFQTAVATNGSAVIGKLGS